MYYRIMSEFEDKNYHVKECEKARLKDKFHWLLLNYYPYSVRDDGQNYVMPDPSTRVTVIDNDPQNPLDIRPEELSVLALGPKFALSRKVDEKLVDEVEVNLAQCAYMCRWKKHWESSDETSARVTSMYEQAKQHKCSFQRPFIAAPPVEDPTLELNLRLLNRFVMDIVKDPTTKSDNNLTRQQKLGLKLLKERENLHISKSDKCGDFVITTMDNYRRMTIKHLETTTGVYKWIHPTRKVNGIETPVQCTTSHSHHLPKSNQQQMSRH